MIPFLLLCSQFLSHGSPSLSLSAVSMLLPFSSNRLDPVWEKLEATDCVFWKTDQKTVIELRHLDDTQHNCPPGTARAMKVVAVFDPLTISGIEDKRMSAVITVEGPDKGVQAECQVFVDRIDKLQIKTRTKVVHMGEVEALAINAYDTKMNIFSSVNTLPFEWKIPSELTEIDFETARLLTADSGYYAGHFYEHLEQSSRSDWKPVQGHKTGIGQISVRCLDQHHTKAAEGTTAISVVVPLYLKPTGPVVPPACVFSFQLNTKERNRKHAAFKSLPLPNKQYTWDSANQAVATVEASGRFTATIEQGITKITVSDETARENKKYTQVFVESPIAIALDLAREHTPGSEVFQLDQEEEWFLTIGEKYIVRARLMSKNGQEMFICDNLQLILTEPGSEEGLICARAGNEQRYHRSIHYRLDACETGVGKLCVRLGPLENGALSYTPSLELESCKLVHVTSRVTYPMKEDLLLPYTGHVNHHRYNLYAEGGSGRGYMFASQNPTKAAVTTEGDDAKFGTIISAGIGESSIVACDIANPSNCAEKLCHIATPAELKYLPGQKEVLVESNIILEFLVLGPGARMFTVVEGIELEAYTDLPYFTVNSRGLYSSDHDSWRIELFSREPGIAIVHVGIQSIGSELPLQEVKIAGYKIVTVEPADILVTVNAPRTFTYSGGPLSWDDSRDSVAVLELEDKENLRYDQSVTSMWNILCTGVHEQKLGLSVHSPPTVELPKPQTAKASLSIKCVMPLVLEDDIYLSVGEHKPLILPSWLESEPNLMDLLILEIDDEEIVKLEINDDGISTLVGKRLGSTIVRVRVDHPSLADIPHNLDGLHALIHVHVEFQSFTVVIGAENLLLGNWVLAHVKGYNNEMPDSINFDIGGVEVEWSIESNSVLEIHPVLENRDFTQTVGAQSVTGPSIRLYGKARGRAQVDVYIRVTNLKERNFTETLIVNVISLPSSQTLIVPPAARIDLMPKIEQRNEVSLLLPSDQISGDHVSIDDTHWVRTDGVKAPLDETVLVSFSEEQYHSSSIALVISVRDPAGLLLVPEQRPDGPGVVVGEMLTLQVYMHDNLGRRFSSAKGWASSTLLQCTSSNPQAVRVETVSKSSFESGVIGTLSLTAIAEGIAVVGVGIQGHQELQTYIKVAAYHREQGHPIIRIVLKILPNAIFHNFQGPQAAAMIQTLIAFGLDVSKARIVIERIDLQKSEMHFRILGGEKLSDTIYSLAEKFTQLFWKRGQSWGFDFGAPPQLVKMVIPRGTDPKKVGFVFIGEDGKDIDELQSSTLLESSISVSPETIINTSFQIADMSSAPTPSWTPFTSSVSHDFDDTLPKSFIKVIVAIGTILLLYYLNKRICGARRTQVNIMVPYEDDENLHFHNEELQMRVTQSYFNNGNF